MATFGGQDYTNFRAVSLRGSVNLRFAVDAAAGTLRADLSEGLDRAYTLPNKSGTLPISGTFTVNLGVVAANDILSTNVTVSGIRAEDAIVTSIQNMTTTGIGTRGFVFIGGCSAGNGGVHMTFVNATDTGTIYKDIVIAYTAVR